MLKTINDYFYFSQKERRGIIALLSIIIILIGINSIIIPQLGNEKPINKDEFIAWVDSLMQNPNDTIQNIEIEYFNFDPNKITKDDWLKLGLTENQFKVIFNFKKAGGKFYKKEDLKKIYTISDQQYLKLEPYIIIQKTYSKHKPNSLLNLSIELNSTDSAELTSISGIGPVLAKRIIKYRSLLGGYSKPFQLKEIYGIDSLKYQHLKPNFSACDISKIKRINLNTATFKQLLKHPYISYDFVKIIVNERRKKLYQSLEDFKDRIALSNLKYGQLKPYLTTEK